MTAPLDARLSVADSLPRLAQLAAAEDLLPKLSAPLDFQALTSTGVMPALLLNLPVSQLLSDAALVQRLHSGLSEPARKNLVRFLKRRLAEVATAPQNEAIEPLKSLLEKHQLLWLLDAPLNAVVPAEFKQLNPWWVSQLAVREPFEPDSIRKLQYWGASEARLREWLRAAQTAALEGVERWVTSLAEIEARLGQRDSAFASLGTLAPNVSHWLGNLLDKNSAQGTVPASLANRITWTHQGGTLNVEFYTSLEMHARPPRVTFLSDEGEGGLCSCSKSPNPCPHLPAAVRMLALAAIEKKVPSWVRKAEAALSVPRWRRDLDAVMQPLLRPSSEVTRIQWRLSGLAYSEPYLLPLVTSLSERGEWSPARPIRTRGEVMKLLPSLEEPDRSALQLWATHSNEGAPATPQILRLVAGQRDVYLADGAAIVKLNVVPETMTASLELDSDDVYRFAICAGTLRFEGAELAGLVHDLSTRQLRSFIALSTQKENTLYCVDVPEPVFNACKALVARPVEIPAARLPEAQADLLKLTDSKHARLPDSVVGQAKAPDLLPRWVVSRQGPASLRFALRFEPIEGAGRFLAGQGARKVRGAVHEKLVWCERDFAAEMRARDAVRMAVVDEAGEAVFLSGDDEWMTFNDAKTLELIAAIEAGEFERRWIAAWETPKPSVTVFEHPSSFPVEIKPSRDWFQLEGLARIGDDVVELAVILEALRRDRRAVELGDNKWLLIRGELERNLKGFANASFEHKQKTVLRRSAPLALKDTKAAKSPEAWKAWVAHVEAAQAKRFVPPAEFRQVLRPYQAEGVRWLLRLAQWRAGGVLADDMGLGKTVQALAVLSARSEAGPALVVAPTSVCINWKREAARFAPDLSFVVLNETSDRAGALAEATAGQVWVISYGLLIRELEALRQTRWSTLIFDEAQNLKNPDAQRTEAAAALQSDFRFALTGTPLENSVVDLWSIFEVVFPGVLGDLKQFRARFEAGNPMDQKQRREALSQLVRPFILRRTKDKVAADLPAKTEVILPVELSREEQQVYDRARIAAAAELSKMGEDTGAEKKRFEILAALTRLRRIACHPALEDPKWKGPTSKLSRVLEVLDTLKSAGHRALVFSQFVGHLALLRAQLPERGITHLDLDGSTPLGERQKRVDAFQKGDADCFLISLKAGGFGLNLTRATYVLHLDPWWNPAAEDQATDRAHRLGQLQPVTAYRFVTRNTIEEEILKLHDAKRDMVDAVLSGTTAAARLGVKDLMALVR